MIEDRLRAATRAAAETVAPGSAPPLRLPDLPSRRPAARWRPGRPWLGWLAPLAAAAAVTAVVAGSVTISGVFHGPQAGTARSGPEQVPPYYVALVYVGKDRCCSAGKLSALRTYAVVRATRTGAALATITPPKPYGTFIGVAGAADDRTFVLAAERYGTQRGSPSATTFRFFLLRISPLIKAAGGRARLTPLRVPPEPAGFGMTNFALSPLGKSLAVASTPDEIQVFNLMTGARRTWQGQAVFPYYFAAASNAMLSWQNEHTLAFAYDNLAPARPGNGRKNVTPPGARADGVRLLDTRAPGSSLLADSRLAQPSSRAIVGHSAFWRQILPTADGRTIITVLEFQSTKGTGLGEELAAFSLRTRKLRVLMHLPVNRLRTGYEAVLWVSPSGRVLVVSETRPVHDPLPGFSGTDARVLTPGHSRPIPWSNRTFAAAW